VAAQLADRRRLVLTTLADGVGMAEVEALRPALARAGWRLEATGPFLEVWAR
jgi:hypothetical protein